MKITISGTPASGKSSVARILAEKLGFRHYSIGDLQRELANEHGVDIVEWGKIEAEDKKFDLMIDQRQREIGKEEHFVIDSWLSPKFIPDAFKVFVDADLEVRAMRRLHHRRKEDNHTDLSTVKKKMLERERINKERWLKYYDFDYTDRDNYDLIIDTGNLTIQQVVDRILDRIKSENLNMSPDSKRNTASSKD